MEELVQAADNTVKSSDLTRPAGNYFPHAAVEFQYSPDRSDNDRQAAKQCTLNIVWDHLRFHKD